MSKTKTQARPEIEMLAVERLVPYAKNAKKHDDRQVAAIAGSIREFGFTNPVLIDGQNGIIAGHGRVLGAKLAGLAEVPCIRIAHLTDNQRRAYILADNRLAETGGGWDLDMLRLEADAIAFDALGEFGRHCLDLDALLGEMADESGGEDMEEQSEDLKPYAHVHLLISMTPNQAAEHLPRLMKEAKAIGAEVNHAGN